MANDATTAVNKAAHVDNVASEKLYNVKVKDLPSDEQALQEKILADAAVYADQLRRKASDITYAGSYTAQLEAQKEIADIEAGVAERIDFTSPLNANGEEYWDNQVLADLTVGATQAFSGLQLLPYGVAAMLNQGSITEVNREKLNRIGELENEKMAAQEYMVQFAKSGQSQEAIDAERQSVGNRMQAIDAEIQKLGTEIDGTTFNDRLADFSKSRIDAANATSEAIENFDSDKIFKSVAEVAKASAKEVGTVMAGAPELAMIGYNTLQGKSDREIAQEVKNLSGFIAQEQQEVEDFAASIQDPRIREGLTSQLTDTFNSTLEEQDAYDKAVESGDDVAAAKAAGSMMLKLAMGYGKSFAENPRAVASLATEEGVQFLAGAPLKLTATGGKIAMKSAIDNATKKSLAQDIGKGQAKLKVKADDTSYAKIRAGNKAKDSANTKLDKIDALATPTTYASMLGESAGQGLNIYNTALQDYMDKTNGAIPSQEESQAMITYSVLAAGADLFTDKLVGGSAGLLGKIKKESKVAGLTQKEADRIAKGIANRTIRAAGKGAISTLEKSGKLAGKKAIIAGTEGSTEAIQTDLEMNLANYLLGEERVADSNLQAWLAGAQGAMAATAIQGPKAVLDATTDTAKVAIDTTKNVASSISADIDTTKVNAKINDAKAAVKDEAAKRGIGSGKVSFDASGDFDDSKIDTAIANGAGFTTQVDEQLRKLVKGRSVAGNPEKIDKVLANVEKVLQKSRTAMLDNPDLRDNDEYFENYLRIKAVQDKYSALNEENAGAIKNIAKAVSEQKAAGIADKDLKIDKAEVEKAVKYFGSNPASIKKLEPKQITMMQSLASIAGATDLAVALHNRVMQAKVEGRLRKQIGEKQTDSKSSKEAGNSLINGSPSFVGLKEYLYGAKTISKAAQNAGNKADKEKAQSEIEKIRNSVRALTLRKRQRAADLNKAADLIEQANGIVTPEAQDLLGKQKVTYISTGALRNLAKFALSEFKTSREYGIAILNEEIQLKSLEASEATEEEAEAKPAEEAKAEPLADEKQVAAKADDDGAAEGSEAGEAEESEAQTEIDDLEKQLKEEFQPVEEVKEIEKTEQSLGEALLENLPNEITSLEEVNAIRKEKKQKLLTELYPRNSHNLIKKFFIPSKNILNGTAEYIMEAVDNGQEFDFEVEPNEAILVEGLVEIYKRVSASLDDAVKNIAEETFLDDTYTTTKQQLFSGNTNYLRQLIGKDGKIPIETKKAIALGMYKFILANQRAMNNLSPEELMNSFGYSSAEIEKGVELPKKIYQKYKYAGLKDTKVIEGIGQNAFRYLGLKSAGEDAPANFRQAIEITLGTLATHVMNDKANSDIFRVSPISSVAYNEDILVARNSEPSAESNSSNIERKFYSLSLPRSAGQHNPEGAIATIIGYMPLDSGVFARNFSDAANQEIMLKESERRPKGLEYDFDQLFIAEKEHRLPKRSAKAAKGSYKKRNNGFVYPEAQKKDLETLSETPYRVNTELNSFFNNFFLSGNESANVLSILGYKSEEEMADMINADRVTAEGRNVQIESDLDKWASFINANQNKNLSTQEFFLTADLQAQNRLHFVNTDINPLLSKIHRSLFSLSNSTIISTDPRAEDNFMYRVAVLQKAGLLADTDDAEAVETKFEEFFINSVYRNAVESYRKLMTNVDDVTQEDWDNIKAFTTDPDTAKADTPSAGLELLADEMKRQDSDENYETRLTVSMDGISSGLALSVLFLSGSNPRADEIISKMGIFAVNSSEQSLAEVAKSGKYDAYETVAFGFLNYLQHYTTVDTSEMFNESLPPKARAFLTLTSRANGFTWEDGITADGKAQKKIRKLMKTGIVAKIFGQGEVSQAEGMQEWVIDSAHTIMRDALKRWPDYKTDEQQQELMKETIQVVNKALIAFTGQKKAYVSLANVKSTNLRQDDFREDIKSNRRNPFAEMVEQFNFESDNVLFAFVKNRDLINKSINAQYEMYVAIRDALIRQKKREYAKDPELSKEYDIHNGKQGTMNLPQKEYDAIDKLLLPIAPKIKTPYAEDGNYATYLSGFKAKDEASQNTPEYIKTAGLSFNLDGPRTDIAPSGGTIKAVHSFEAAVALKASTIHDVLSTHDAQTTSLADAEAHAIVMNQTLANLYNEHDILKTVMEGVSEAIPLLREKLNAYHSEMSEQEIVNIIKILKGINEDDFLQGEQLAAIFDESGTWKSLEGPQQTAFLQILKDRFYNPPTRKDKLRVASYRLKNFENVVESNKNVSAKMPTEMTGWSHYALANIKYDTGVEAKPDEERKTFYSSPIGEADSIFGNSTGADFKLTATNIVDKLQMLRYTGHRAESNEHMAYLTDLLGRLVNPHIEDIQVHYDATGKYPAAGRLELSQSGTDIYLNAATGMNEQATRYAEHGVAMSGAEMLSHEVAHALTESLIERGHPIMQEVEKLWKLAAENPDIIAAEDLIPDGDTAPDALLRAQATYDYIFTPRLINNPRYVQTTLPGLKVPRQRSAHLDEFVAFMMTNEKLREKLSSVDVNSEPDTQLGKFRTRMAKVLNKAYVYIMKKLGNYKIDSTDPNYTEQFDRLMHQLFVAETKANNRIISLLQNTSTTVNNVAGFTIDKSKYTLNRARHSNFVDKVGGKYGRAINRALDFLGEEKAVKDKIITPALDAVENKISSVDLFGIEEILAEIRGNTPRNSFASTLIRLRNTYESKERQETMDATRKVLMKPFLNDGESEVDAETQKLLFNGLIQTDIAALLEHKYSGETKETQPRTRDELYEYLRDLLENGGLQAEIALHRNEIGRIVKDDEATNAYHRAAKSLGHYLVNQEHTEAIATSSVQQIIETVPDVLGKDLSFDEDRLRHEINTLGTLEALAKTPEDTIRGMMNLLDNHSYRPEEEDGVFRMIKAHKELQDRARNSELFTDNFNFMKGYYKEVGSNPQLSVVVVTAEEAKDLNKHFYKKVGKVKVDPFHKNQPERFIYTTEYDSTLMTLVQGAFSYSARKSRGGSWWDSPRNVADENVNGQVQYDAEFDFKVATIIRRNAIRNDMTKPISATESPIIYSTNAFQKRGKDGKLELYDLRAQMNWETKVNALETQENPFEILSHTAGNMVSKIRGRKVNKLVINELIEDHKKNKSTLPANAYIWIGPGKKKGTRDEQRWAMLPKETRDYIYQATGEQGIYVRRDLANSIFGYRKVSVRNLLDYLEDNKEAQDLFHRTLRAYINSQLGSLNLKLMAGTEDILTELTGIIKDSVVVKSILVNAVNMISNTVQLLVNGMSVMDALKYQGEAIKYGVEYSQAHARRKEIRIELSSLSKEGSYKKRLEAEEALLTDKMSRSPVASLMESGAMQTIVEDIESYQYDLPNLKRQHVTRIGKKVLERTPNIMQNAFSELTMSDNTAFYKWANNAVKLSDFSARYALIRHLEANQPEMTDEQRLRKAMDEFIDYDIPTNRWIQYFNDIGFLWFTKYGLRSIGVAARLAVDHPENVAKLYLTETLFGDISTVMDFNAPGRFGSVWGRLESGIESIAPINFAEALLN